MAETGEADLAFFQAVASFDVWYRDFPANPNLIRIPKRWQWIDAVAQISKQGMTYVFDRETGEPSFGPELLETPRNSIHRASEGDCLLLSNLPTLARAHLWQMTFQKSDIINLKPDGS